MSTGRIVLNRLQVVESFRLYVVVLITRRWLTVILLNILFFCYGYFITMLQRICTMIACISLLEADMAWMLQNSLNLTSCVLFRVLLDGRDRIVCFSARSPT